MADELKTDLSNCLPIVRHPSTGSGECSGLENTKVKAGQTSDWNLPQAAFKANNPPQDFWQDEESELFIIDDETGDFIELA